MWKRPKRRKPKWAEMNKSQRIKRVAKSPFLWLGLIILATNACTIGFDEDFPGNETIKREARTLSYDTTDVNLSYLRAGSTDGQRVIFVHGTPGSASNWLSYLENVPEGFEFIAIDRPGFGSTLPRKAMVELDDQAAALEPFLIERNGKFPILVGHSLGGPIIAAAAANYPDRIAGMVQLAGSLDPDLEELLFIQYVGELPPFVWMIPKDLRNTNREIFALEEELRILARKLDRITTPTIIVHGTLDELVPYANVPYMKDRFSNAARVEIVTLDGQNHFLPWNSATAVKMAIDRIARNFPGDPRPDIVVEAAKLSQTPGLSPQDSIFNQD